MTVERLRPLPSPDALARLYRQPHDHTRWPDHVLRVKATLAMVDWLSGPVESAADLSAGRGWLLDRVEAHNKTYGDLATTEPGWLRGPIEQTVDRLERVSLFLCCETLEHLDDPGAVLSLIRTKTRDLVLSTPLGAWDDPNPEHLWAWDRAGVERLLTEAGFRVVAYNTSDARPSNPASYRFGIWGCR